MGTYALPVVLLSYGVAVLAAYTALEMAGKVMRPHYRVGGWLAAGAVAMGTGIWSMHFVGMEAIDLPFEVIYDGPLTLLSWLAAVGVSALALATLTLLRRQPDRLDPKVVIPAGIIMGAGICIMHYSGMAAMRLSPGIEWNALLVAASVLIAVAASVVTLLIAAKLRRVRHWTDVVKRLGAAMVMGLAIAGMHYTGMFAATFASDAVCMSTTGFAGGWTVGPVTFATLAILASALVLSIGDSQAIRARRQAERELNEQVNHKAFTDGETDLPNRSWLTRQLADGLAAGQQTVTLIVLDPAEGGCGSQRVSFANWLRAALPEAQAVRLQGESFGLLFYNQGRDLARKRVVQALEQSDVTGLAAWRLGSATFPEDTEQLFRLVPRARADVDAVTAG
ncbi:MAG: MHYT domain-containing protein [Wenzhouxiangella sp.]